MNNGSVAVVTGGSGGIGREISIALSENKKKIAIHFYKHEDEAKVVEKIIKEMGGDAILVRGDVRNYNDVKRMRDEVIAAFGRIDILINNAGINKDTLFMNMNPDEWEEVLSVNLTGAFNCIKVMIDDLVKSGNGYIINISSIVGLMGNIGQANYAASKAGLIGLTKTLAKELASKNITVNVVAPGFIGTPMLQKVPEKVKEKIISQIPMKRFGSAREIAKAVVFLSSEDARYITGTVLNVNGGLYI
ncbi:MAG: 3-oxoacyl-[acyl-carrier-protein] reductase [Candidatus Thermoplasmatota archaeon]|jgi:3-oxoacyl-[acyl-carrier protein] reductase|nr:3-oxoacyl-[acyl-carrier-protein] reductase [Candidatus Thermoplasmatota archaeon]MCL5963429.1 3-oxoacyl-[acyl-carrier-protein] reductase [Candidatus Thermoplasmatota archaeon]